MELALIVSGAVLWALVACGVLAWLRSRRFVRQILARPALYPYSKFVGQRIALRLLPLQRLLGLVPWWATSPEFIRSRSSIELRHFKELRDAYEQLDPLPTIEKGKRALGIDSIFDIRASQGRFGKTDFTDPLQTPSYFLPGVPARAFYDPYDFGWTRPLEEAFPVIKQELMSILDADGLGFQSYVNEYSGVHQEWNTFNLFFHGEKFEENCARCPQTTRLLEGLPRFEKDHIMFSALNPHSEIPPHCGPMNGILRAHLPLIVPEGCYIKVGDEERSWEEGKVMVFDDSFLHQVWNHGDHLRIVLFLNFWHPCFEPEEIAVLERFRRAYEKNPVTMQHAHNQRKKRSHTIKKVDERARSGPASANA